MVCAMLPYLVTTISVSMSVFHGEVELAGLPRVCSSACPRRETLHRQRFFCGTCGISDTKYLQAECLSRHSANSVKELKVTRITDFSYRLALSFLISPLDLCCCLYIGFQMPVPMHYSLSH